MMLARAARDAAAEVHRLADALERVANAPSPQSAPSGADTMLADAVRRGMTPQFIDALKKALKL